MKEKFNKNAKVEKLSNMLGIAVRLIVIDPLSKYNLMYYRWNRGGFSPLPHFFLRIQVQNRTILNTDFWWTLCTIHVCVLMMMQQESIYCPFIDYL